MKHTISFMVEGYEGIEFNEYALRDLLTTAVLPALNLELVPSTFETRKSRS